MNNNYSPPSGNYADSGHLAGVLDFFFSKSLQRTDDMLPAIVIAYNRTTNRAQVQPLIATVTTDNRLVPKGQVASVPVLQLGGNGFVMSFPLQSGDLGWIKANDRDISLFLQTLTQSPPNTQRKHRFSDAMFIPDTFFKGVAIASEDVNNSVWQNLAGTVKIALWSTFIKMIGTVGIGGTPNANAVLDLQSTTKAFIYPRMTTAQRNAIPSPVEGMTIWNLDTHGLSSYNGSAWS